MKIKCYDKYENCVLDSAGKSAEKVLLKLLFDKYIAKDKDIKVIYRYNGATPNEQKMKITTKVFTYIITEIPTEFYGGLDTYKLKEMEVK